MLLEGGEEEQRTAPAHRDNSRERRPRHSAGRKGPVWVGVRCVLLEWGKGLASGANRLWSGGNSPPGSGLGFRVCRPQPDPWPSKGPRPLHPSAGSRFRMLTHHAQPSPWLPRRAKGFCAGWMLLGALCWHRPKTERASSTGTGCLLSWSPQRGGPDPPAAPQHPRHLLFPTALSGAGTSCATGIPDACSLGPPPTWSLRHSFL